eukprot:143459_1
MEGYTYFGIPCCAILFCILFAFLIHAIGVHCQNNSDFTKNRSAEILYFTSLGFLSFCMLDCILLSSVPIWHPTIETYLQYTAYTSYTLGAAFSFSLFVHSLHASFHDTNHAYPSWVLWLIATIQWIFIVFIILFDIYAFWVDWSVFHYHVLIYFPFEFVINFVLLVLFNRVLLRVAKEMFMVSNQSKEVQDLLNIIVRGTVLIGLMTFWGLLVLFLTSCVTNGVTFGLTVPSFENLIWTVQYIQCAVMGYAVYLKHRAGNTVYHKTCGLTHRVCLYCSHALVQKLWETDIDMNRERDNSGVSTSRALNVAGSHTAVEYEIQKEQTMTISSSPAVIKNESIISIGHGCDV